MAASRKAARQALGALLQSVVTAAQDVYRYQKTDFGGATPVIVVSSGSSTRERLTMRGSGATFQFDIHIFVFHRDPANGWTEEMAEDLLDDIEQQICEAVDQNQRTDAWQAIKYSDTTDARQPVTIGGATYLYEVIPVQVTVPQ